MDINRNLGSGLDDAFPPDELQRYRTVQFTVATSTFGSIFTVAVFCGCFYFACSKHHRQIRKDLWQRGGIGKGNNSPSNSTNMLITPYPTNPDLGTPYGGNVDMNYTGAAPQMPVTGYSYDPVEPSYILDGNSEKYNELLIVPPLYGDGNTNNDTLMSKAAIIKEKIKISQPGKFVPGMNFYSGTLNTVSSRELLTRNQTQQTAKDKAEESVDNSKK